MISTQQQKIQKTLMGFYSLAFSDAAVNFFQCLGYKSKKCPSNKTEKLFDTLKKNQIDISVFDQNKIQLDKWKKSAFLFQLEDDDLPAIFLEKSVKNSNSINFKNASSVLFFAIELENRIWTTEEMCTIAKEIDRHFVMPTIFLFRYGNLLTLLIHQKKKTNETTSSFALIRNLRILHPTRPHTEMLSDLDSRHLKERKIISSCSELFDAWFNALSAYNREEKTFLQKTGMLAFI